MRLSMAAHFDCNLLASDAIESLRAGGYDVVKVGTVPYWMEELLGEPGCYYVKGEYE